MRLPASWASAGEWLAEARALEAAGAHSIWLAHDALQPRLDPWMLLSALAVATSQVRLVAPAAVPPGAAETASARTLAELSRSRILLQTTGAEAVTRRLFEFADPWPDESGPLLHGFVHLEADPEAARQAFDALRREHRALAGLRYWSSVEMPAGRAAWRDALAVYSRAGATGVILDHDPRLLDLLRNPDAEDDRSDLQLATG